MSLLLVLIPAMPLAGSLLCALLGPRILRGHSHVPVVAAIAASFVCSVLLLRQLQQAEETAPAKQAGVQVPVVERTYRLWTWAVVDPATPQSGNQGSSRVEKAGQGFRIEVCLRADALTVMMLTMVTFISTLIAVFAVGYMRGDPGYWRFFSYIALFVFSMTMLVSVSNFLLLYVFWEAVGVCSYLLIGFWYQKPEAAAAGKKAFLVNRVGDLGLAFALFLLWMNYGTLDFHDTWGGGASRSTAAGSEAAAASTGEAAAGARHELRGVLSPARIAARDYVGGAVGTAICLLLMLGACGKSAQFPLHVWLPDAMEGPTPVSALIHAATMVTAGVYLIARCAPLFMVSPEAQLVVACIGAGTALLAALIALTQFDLKRVLAYSTISQLGYMFLGLGAGTFLGTTAGLFHLFTHAFFKALLFLGAGSVMHAMGNVIDMRRFGGLRKTMPITHATFLVGCLALAGIPPFAGFWSKDAILAAVEEKSHGSGHGVEAAVHAGEPVAAEEVRTEPASSDFATVYGCLYGIGLLTAFLTVCYTFRAFFLTFYGKEQIPHEAGHHAHESPPVMWCPLAILALGAVLVGFGFDRTYIPSRPTHLFSEFLAGTPSIGSGAVGATKVEYKFHGWVALTSSAVALAGLALVTILYAGERRGARWVRSFLDFEKWPQGLGHLVSPYRLSQGKFFLDELYELIVVFPLRGLAAASYAVDRWIVDGLVDFVGRVPLVLGSVLRSLQMGLVQFYALAMFLGVLVLIAAKYLWAAG